MENDDQHSWNVNVRYFAHAKELCTMVLAYLQCEIFSCFICLSFWRLVQAFAHIFATANAISTNLGVLERSFKGASVANPGFLFE